MGGTRKAADLVVWGMLTFGVMLALVLFIVQRLR
jgi:hypothetical protein